jgi:hypothetical protein
MERCGTLEGGFCGDNVGVFRQLICENGRRKKGWDSEPWALKGDVANGRLSVVNKPLSDGQMTTGQWFVHNPDLVNHSLIHNVEKPAPSPSQNRLSPPG